MRAVATTLMSAATAAATTSYLVPIGGNTPYIEPFQPLSGGSFTGTPVPTSPDPLQTYVWEAPVNGSALQAFGIAPAYVNLTTGSPATNWVGWESLARTGAGRVTVSGGGGLVLDFGVESAAWVEIDVIETLADSDLHLLTLGISEYDEVLFNNVGLKAGVPVGYAQTGPSGESFTTYRLELPHPGLYEGVRYGWIMFNATPTAPFTITAARAVAQIKPQNYFGAYHHAAGDGDTLLERIWWTSAYTVKVNLLADQFGSILVYRGDRFSWTGDAHVAQATALIALDPAFVFTNLVFTQDNCNGIESYCLYFVLSVTDYFEKTGDAAGVLALLPAVTAKLDHAHAIWGAQPPPALGFIGWDDRTGSGFANATADEPERVYRMLAVRAWRAAAAMLGAPAVNQSALAVLYSGYADAATAATRADTAYAGGSGWWATPFGLFAAADAINAGVANASEAAALVAALAGNAGTVCGLSNFNSFFVLQALAASGALDDAGLLDVVALCWGVQLELGATTTWETSSPGWTGFLAPSDVTPGGGPRAIPGFEDGYTSLAHPWSSGAAPWLTAWSLGARPTAPGWASFLVAPHLPAPPSAEAAADAGVSGAVPTPHGPLTVAVSADGVAVDAPAACEGVLQLSPALLRRLGLRPADALVDAATGSVLLVVGDASAFEPAGHHGAPADDGDGGARLAVRLPLPRGRTRWLWRRAVTFSSSATAALPAVASSPYSSSSSLVAAAASHSSSAEAAFPPPAFPATLVAVDTTTGGSWIGTYGSAGHVLFAYDGPGQHVVSLPPFVASVSQAFGRAESGPWLQPPPASDPRALQDPRNASAPRKIGQLCVGVPPGGAWDPSFPVDVDLTPQAEGAANYTLAVYMVDYDGRGRRQTVRLRDRASLGDAAPEVLVGPPDFTGGVWLVYRYDRSVRLRFNLIRGDNQVVSAIMFS